MQALKKDTMFETMKSIRLDDENPQLFLRVRNNGKMRDNYKILANPLGQGAYGEVRKCIFKDGKDGIRDKNNRYKEYRAVKVMSKAYMEHKNILDFQNEVAVNLMLNHPNIAKIYEWYEDENRYMLISELVKGGELFDLISEKKFEAREAGIILKQLVSTINYMHKPPNGLDNPDGKYGIVHRDLKPENILLSDSEDMLPEIKLIDFGTAKKFEYYEFSEGIISTSLYKYPIGLKEKVGTLNYMAPEIMMLDTSSQKKIDPKGQNLDDYQKNFYSEKVDIWSIGVIAFVLLTGKPLFNDNQPMKGLMDEIKTFHENPESDAWKEKQTYNSSRPHYFEDQTFTRLPEDVQDFIKACLKKNPTQRASCEELLNSSWMKNLQAELVEDITKKDHGDVSEIHKIAKNSLKALMHFNQKQKGTVKFSDLSKDDKKRIILKEACLALIAHLFLDNKQKTTLRKIFKIMDFSGDGQLEADELRTGFNYIFDNEQDLDLNGKSLFKKEWTDEDLETIINNVDHDENGHLEWRDFLMASVDLTQDSFKKYCERAYERFFTNETSSMQTSELFELLCKENIFRREYIQEIIELFDQDASDSIQYEELVGVFIDNLRSDISTSPDGQALTYADIEIHIEERFEIDLKNAE